jgi:hypothetical protein
VIEVGSRGAVGNPVIIVEVECYFFVGFVSQ